MTPHEMLLTDLVDLLVDASKFAFHDFKGEAVTPKIDLVNRLQRISEQAKYGKYDDQADAEDIDALRKICERENMPEEMIKVLGLK